MMNHETINDNPYDWKPLIMYGFLMFFFHPVASSHGDKRCGAWFEWPHINHHHPHFTSFRGSCWRNWPSTIAKICHSKVHLEGIHPSIRPSVIRPNRLASTDVAFRQYSNVFKFNSRAFACECACARRYSRGPSGYPSEKVALALLLNWNLPWRKIKLAN